MKAERQARSFGKKGGRVATASYGTDPTVAVFFSEGDSYRGASMKLKRALPGIILSGLVAALLDWLDFIPFIYGFLMTLAAIILNGFLAEWEDNRPGGFNNPNGRTEK